mmetsp:Transcript_58380/g.162738  ORF Transcript_58380/g.162738 Transcript_58380/m.162738 type:complete len:744 (-) Transcript_58380:98-2329(-)
MQPAASAATAFCLLASFATQAQCSAVVLRGVSAANTSLGTFSFEAGSASPVVKVVELLHRLEATIQSDGKVEQQSFDKGACWCEDTLARKAKDISDAKKKVMELQSSILDLEGDVATHKAEVKQLKKDIKANKAAQRDASNMRAQSNAEYVDEKTDAEQSIGALEAAIKVLTGAGTGGKKSGFLETTMQQAQLLSVAGGVQAVLQRPLATRTLSVADLRAAELFVEKPVALLASSAPRPRHGALGVLQVEENPFGDYAPQSTRIQGILKGLYDAFTSSLEKANAEEADEEKGFQELMATKSKELSTLEMALDAHSADGARKSKDLSVSKQLRDDTQAQLAVDEELFTEVTAACKDKAMHWAERSRLRTEELQGIGQAIDVLSSPEAIRTFKNATTTLLQVDAASAASSATRALGQRRGTMASRRLRQAAAKMQSGTRAAKLLSIAARAEAGGHFDAVIAAIDDMIGVLRREEQDDIEHRDRCQGSTNKNKNEMEDLDHAIGKASAAIQRMENTAGDLTDEIASLEDAIKRTKAEMEEALKMRNKESKEFKQALQDDMDAISLLDKAIVFMTAFYKRNNIAMAFLQQHQEPEYAIDVDAVPNTDWEGAGYEGRKSESSPIISMIAAIKEKFQNEVAVARKADADAQAAFEKERAAARASVKAQTTTKVATATELAEINAKLQDTKAYSIAKKEDLVEEGQMKAALYVDCSWVSTHFDSRREARKTEMDGLADAKKFLAGVETEE